MKKIHFSSRPIKSSASPNDENDGPNLLRGLNLQKPMKQTVKTFSFPRKKVLGERNESPGSNSSITHFSKSPSLDSKPSPNIIAKASQMNSPNLDPKVNSKEPAFQKTPLSYGSRDGTPSPGPYDPLKNYLSPRPQFLRYNPDRRKEIFLRLEMEGKEGDNSTLESDEADTVSSDNSSLASSSSSQEDEEFGVESESLSDKEDEEFEEGEDETAWSLGGVLKYFLLLVVLLLSTSYISSMNSPVSAPAFEVPTLGFRNLSFGIDEGSGYKFLDGKKELLGLLSVTQTMEDEVIVESEEMVEEELIMKGEASEEFAENIELQEIEENEINNVEKIEDELEEFELQEMGETGEKIEETQDVVEEKLVGDLEIEQQGQQTTEEIEFLQDDQQASLFSEGTESSEEIREVPREEDENLHMVQVLIMQISMLQKWGRSISLNFQEVDPLKGLNHHMGTEMFLKVTFGFLTCAAIVASFVFGFNIRRKGIAPKLSSSPVDKHSTEPVEEDKKPSLPLPAERDDPIKFAVSNTMPLITTFAVGSRAPSVELMAEFDFCEISRSVKSSAINSRMKDQVGSYSYFSEKDLGSKDRQGYSDFPVENSNSSERSNSTSAAKRKGKELVGSNEVITPVRRSAVNSNSSDRSVSTTAAKRKGKELGSNNEVITPVRRSARIRNRADIVSP
ncbi:uncharacterized protein LOC120159427 [Hibiscus syriacus]|uniref:uncharacterized protein LOC120159427 n=1 Tax=Hibiscus syriacus TaxID=106335 RepID=UPI001921AE8C|nr:uncharacterized protein LOC120159427 [Hibiscus syriacus]